MAWKDGEEEYVKTGARGTSIATFPNRQRASEQVEFMRMGMEDEVESIDVVMAPRIPKRRLRAAARTEGAPSPADHEGGRR